MLPFSSSRYRTHAAGALRPLHVGETVRLSGFVNSIRRYRRHAFVELREATGLVQLVVSLEQSQGLTEESAICIEGQVVVRFAAHPRLAEYPTGEVEVSVATIEVLGLAGSLPFSRHESPGESEMLRHRTLALRWNEHQAPLRQRAAIVSAMRRVAEEAGCLEVETPVLVRNTPGGATPYLVPVSKEAGYALAQSPQIWKQLLVCGGIERYYQLAHCFRNEGSRPERQPEFSQFEIEFGFTTAEEVQAVMEAMVQAAGAAVGATLPAQFPRWTYAEALAQFGSEKPHLGNPLRLISVPAHTGARFANGQASVILPQPLSRAEEKEFLGPLWRSVGEEGLVEVKGPEIVLHGPLESIQLALGALIREIGVRWELIAPGVYPAWVEQFPLFEETPTGLAPAHHPFTRPATGHEIFLETAPREALAEAFDLTMNGMEIGGGSMRAHEARLQRLLFAQLGWEIAESEEHFRPLLEALERGAPPHGGMALGVERLVATLIGAAHIRTVMAFPKTTGGQCLLTGALN